MSEALSVAPVPEGRVNDCFHPSRSIDGLWEHWQKYINSFPSDPNLRITIVQQQLPASDDQPRPKPEAIDVKTVNSFRSALQNNPRTDGTNYLPTTFYLLGGRFGSELPRGLSPEALRLAFDQLDLPPSVLRMIFPARGKDANPPVHNHAGSMAQRVSRRVILGEDGSLARFYMWYRIPYVITAPNKELAMQLKEMTSYDLMETDPSTNVGCRTDEISSTCIVYDHATQTTNVVSFPDELVAPLKVARGLLQTCDRATLSDDPFCIVLAQLGITGSYWMKAYRDFSFERIRLNQEMNISNRIIRPDLLRKIITYHSSRKVKLHVLEETARDLKLMHTQFYASAGRSTNPGSRLYHNIQEEFDNYIAFFNSLGLGYAALLKTSESFLEICHHQTAERDNQRMAVNSDLMKEMTEQSREEGRQLAIIAQETKQDSFAMKTMATVTMVYLPGAFVSSIFGMQIIQVQNGHLTVVKEWPYFAALTIALTVGTLGAWIVWIRNAQRTGKPRVVLKVVDDNEG